MDREHTSTHSLTEILSSAVEFGLTSTDVWETVMAAPDRLPMDLRVRYLDELTGELAERLLEKQRAAQGQPRSTHQAVLEVRNRRTVRNQLVIAAAVTLILIVGVLLAGAGMGLGL